MSSVHDDLPPLVPIFERMLGQEQPKGHSMSDFFGKAPTLRSGEDIDAQIAEERNSWEDE